MKEWSPWVVSLLFLHLLNENNNLFFCLLKEKESTAKKCCSVPVFAWLEVQQSSIQERGQMEQPGKQSTSSHIQHSTPL